MTDERLDALLRDAGEQWRAANARPVTVDFAALGTAVDEDHLVPITPVPAPRRRQRRAVWAVATALAAAAAVVALVVLRPGGSSDVPRPADGPAALVGVDWRLSAMRTESGMALPVALPVPLRFESGRVSGSDGCNEFGGPVTVAPTSVRLGPIASTQVACSDVSKDFVAEIAHVQAVLDGTVRWSVAGETLTLTGPRGTLVYTAVAHSTTTDPAALVGIDWQLTTVQDFAAGIASTPAVMRTLTFDGHGGYVLTHPCYDWTGSVRVDPGTLTVTDAVTQQHACPAHGPGIDDALVGRIFSGTVTWSVENGTLSLRHEGVGALAFEGGKPTRSTDPKDLYGVVWQHDRGTAGSPVVLIVDGKGGYTVTAGGCAQTGSATVVPGRMTLRPAPSPSCSADVPFPIGAVAWSITGGKLTIREPDGTTTVFTR